MSAGPDGHPERLVWYAGGTLDPGEAREVERHLASCPDCDAEVRALQSMMRSIRGQARLDHVPSEELVAFHHGHPQLADVRRRAVQDHLRECGDCSADLARVRQADRAEIGSRANPPEPGARAGSLRTSRRRVSKRVLAFAAGVLLLAGAGWGMVRLSVPAVRRPTDPGILFAPSQRDGNAGRRLEGRGPWEITVLLPFRAPPGPYRATIRQADGTASVVLDTVVETADESTHLVAPASLGSGHYLLTLGPRDGARDSYLYGFDVAASP